MSSGYFNTLNYTLANEDTSLELEVIPEHPGHIMAVAGSGGRVLPLLAKKPSRVTCVDLSVEQLYLTELRIESLRALTHSEFLGFWGYPPSDATSTDRKKLFSRIKLSKKAKAFLTAMLTEVHWQSPLYLGRWERTFSKLSQVNRLLTGTSGIGLFGALTLEEHLEYLENRFPRKAWMAVQTLLGNASVFNALLYKGHFPKKNIPGSSSRFYRDTYDRIFKQGPARRNFFLNLTFFGRVMFAEGCPIECDPDVYSGAKSALRTAQIHYVQGNVVEEASRSQVPVNALSLSDVVSYFSGDIERDYMKNLRTGMADGGLVITRSYLRVPEGTDFGGYADVTHLHKKAIEAEKTQMYVVQIHAHRGKNKKQRGRSK